MWVFLVEFRTEVLYVYVLLYLCTAFALQVLGLPDESSDAFFQPTDNSLQRCRSCEGRFISAEASLNCCVVWCCVVSFVCCFISFILALLYFSPDTI